MPRRSNVMCQLSESITKVIVYLFWICLDRCTAAQNKLRSLHINTPNLQWDDSLAAMAQRYAEKLVEINKNSPKVELVHQRSRRRFGENLYRSDGKEKANCIDASLTWYHLFSYQKGEISLWMKPRQLLVFIVDGRWDIRFRLSRNELSVILRSY